MVFWPQACWILAPQPGIEPAPSALEGELLTTGLPGKSHTNYFKRKWIKLSKQKAKIVKMDNREIKINDPAICCL